MKTTALLVFLFSFTAHCYAQLDPQKMLYLQESERYRKMKNTGTVLTVVGGILFATGFVTIVNTTTSYSQTSSSDLEYGFYAYVGGAACLGAGIPLWIVGGNKQRKYAAKSQGLTVRLNANPTQKGLTFTYRF
jgi:uncharacterized membrane-anchored protein